MILNYSPTRDEIGVKYFQAYKNAQNLAVFWKEFGSVSIEGEDKLEKITFRLFDLIDPDKLQMYVMQLPMIFSSYHAVYLDSKPKKIVLIPKEDMPMNKNTEGLVDKTTERTITEAELIKLRSSPGFMN